MSEHSHEHEPSVDQQIVDLVEDVLKLRRTLECSCHETCHCGNGGGGEGGNDGGGGNGGGGNSGGGNSGGGDGWPWRPTRHPGTTVGGLGGPLGTGDLTPPSPRQWPGPRKDMWLPYLFFRAAPGDTGTRPVAGPFWESPDIYILPGTTPALAPAVPASLGQTALAGTDNTVYAHVWNLGRGKAREVVVEFYWCDPSLGFNPMGAHLIGRAYTWLGDRSSPDCHKVVKCPTSWVATFTNGGHECLLVRAWDVAADPMTTPEWDASINRHLGQRNIHVVPSGESAQPVTLAVGQLFGHPADITVARHAPASTPWLQLHNGVRGQFPGQAVGTGAIMLGHPGALGGGTDLQAHGDGAAVVFASGDAPPPAGQAHVYRVTASQHGQVVGGYTVVMQG